MSWGRAGIILLSIVQAGAMIVNGARALLFGEYFTLRKGPRADEPAVWEGIVSAAGIDPRSLPMKLVFVVYGCLWLVLTYRFARQLPWSRVAMFAVVIGSLWFLGPATPLAVAQLFLLILLPIRRAPA